MCGLLHALLHVVVQVFVDWTVTGRCEDNDRRDITVEAPLLVRNMGDRHSDIDESPLEACLVVARTDTFTIQGEYGEWASDIFSVADQLVQFLSGHLCFAGPVRGFELRSQLVYRAT